MAEYTVQAPDGKTITLQGPDGASEADVIAQAQALYTPKAAAPAARPAARRPAPTRGPAPAAPNRYLEKYNRIRSTGAISKIADPEQRRIAYQRFDADPRVQRLRKLAGLAPVSTKQQGVQDAARDQMSLADLVADRKSRKSPSQLYYEAGQRVGQKSSRLQSFIAGASKGLFGIPQHIQAGVYSVLPSELTGIPKDASYSNILQTIRGRDDASINADKVAGYGGEIGSGLVGGGVAGKAIYASGTRLAAAGLPYLSRAGNILQELGTLRKGQKALNAAKIAATGGAAGGAQAAGTGGDVVEGTAVGAIASPLVMGGVKLGQVITRPFRDVLRLSSAGQILSRLTTATRDQLERRAAAYRSATGAEPTLFELLPLADRNKILRQAVVGKDNIVEQTSDAIRARARNLGPEMSDRARQVLQPNRDMIQAQMRTDLANARGGALAAGDDDLIDAAMENAVDMRRFRQEEARAIMAPHEATDVVPNLEDLFPSVPGPGGTRMGTDPEAAAVIRSAAGTLRARAPGGGVTVGDITDMISTLRGDLAKGGIEGRTAERAINHLQDTLDNLVPAAGDAARRMTDAYAARSRMLEGMKEGAQTRLRGDVYPESRSAAQKLTNAYDTAEGTAGRTVGQGNKIQSDLGGSPEEALRATVRQSRGSTGRQLSQNIGPREADEIAVAARAQDESAQALAAASQKAQSGSGDSADAETLVQAIAGLHPSSFITTKAGAMRRLLDMTYIPESRARTMIEMLFSQDPALMRRALNAVGNEPNGAKFTKYLATLIGQAGANAGTGVDDLPTPDLGSDVPSVEDDLNAGQEGEIEAPDVGDSPYAEVLQNLYATENPDLLELVQRVKGQESGGQQFDDQGRPLESSAGAIGVMQVMPGTGPEAAALAGLPWDENAYYNDPAYNELLGVAYLSEQLRKYNGDVERALAAYNAGPGAVDDALSIHDANWLSTLPAETQDYVARVG